MLSRLMIDQGDLLLLLIRLKRKTVLEYVLVMKVIRPTLTMKYFVKEWEIHCWSGRESWTNDGERGRHGLLEFQDYHIPLWNTRRVPAFDNWFRRLRTIQIDMLFNKIYDKINHLILWIENQNNWFRMWVTSNYVNYSRRNPKRSAQCVYHTAISENSAARAGISCTEEGRIRNSSIFDGLFFQFPEYVIKKGRLHGHRYGEKLGDKEYFTANQLKKRCTKKYLQGIHDRN